MITELARCKLLPILAVLIAILAVPLPTSAEQQDNRLAGPDTTLVYERRIGTSDVLEKKECLPVGAFAPENRAELLRRLRDFASGVGLNYRLSGLVLATCRPISRGDVLSGAYMLMFRGVAAARIRTAGAVQSLQITGDKDPFGFQIAGRKFDLFSFTVAEDPNGRSILFLEIRSVASPPLPIARMVAQFVSSIVTLSAVHTLFYSDNRGKHPPEDLTWGSPLRSPEIECSRTACRLLKVGPIE